jgi:hypothetical protein
MFLSYSHADMQPTDWLARLKMYLTPFSRSGTLDVWDDTKIDAGQVWLAEIDAALKAAEVAILLIGPGFLASSFITDSELPALLSAATGRGLRLFPLVVGYSAYEVSELGQYQAFNPPRVPLESLPVPDQNKILNELAIAVDKSARSRRPTTKPQASNGGSADLFALMKLLREHLADTHIAFVAQIQRRDALVSAIEKRLGFINDMEFEKFFFTYYPQLTPSERFEFDQIRAMTEGSLQEGNRKVLELLETHPELLDVAPKMTLLRQHLRFWLNKYDRVFARTPAMCLLYTGVEDGVPFPPRLDSVLDDWFERHGTPPSS